MEKITNKKFAAEDENFKASVEKAKERGEKVEATGRQASKFRNKRGIAYHFSRSLPKHKIGGENEITKSSKEKGNGEKSS